MVVIEMWQMFGCYSISFMLCCHGDVVNVVLPWRCGRCVVVLVM